MESYFVNVNLIKANIMIYHLFPFDMKFRINIAMHCFSLFQIMNSFELIWLKWKSWEIEKFTINAHGKKGNVNSD